MNKRGRGLQIVVFLAILTLLIVPLTSAGFFSDLWKKITGGVTSPTVLNVTVAGGAPPNITDINNKSIADLTLTEGGNTNVSINFSVYEPDGASTLTDTTAWVNLTQSGESTRFNYTCVEKDSAGNYANYSCIVTMWFWDKDGNWLINASISDQNGNNATNGTRNLVVKPLTGFNRGPATLAWGTVNPGATNQTPASFIILNNTGNQDMGTNNITVNSTDLMGETTDTIGLYSGNFTVSNNSAGTSECDLRNTNAGGSASRMNLTSGAAFNIITGANLSRGNYTKSDGTAQEQLYFCLTLTGTELTSQAYSTHSKGSWTIQISQTTPA